MVPLRLIYLARQLLLGEFSEKTLHYSGLNWMFAHIWLYADRRLLVMIEIMKKLIVLFVVLFSANIAAAKDFTLLWDDNNEVVDGFKVFQRTAGQAYDYNAPIWTGTDQQCDITQLTDNVYYFVVRAFLGEGEDYLESADSLEYEFWVVDDKATAIVSPTTQNTWKETGHLSITAQLGISGNQFGSNANAPWSFDCENDAYDATGVITTPRDGTWNASVETVLISWPYKFPKGECTFQIHGESDSIVGDSDNINITVVPATVASGGIAGGMMTRGSTSGVTIE